MHIYKLAKVDINQPTNLLQVPAVDYVKAGGINEAKETFEEKGHDADEYHIIQMPKTFSWEEAKQELSRNRENVAKKLIMD